MRVIDAALIIAVGATIGGAMGYFGKCATGTCPLTANPWRGALFGVLVASMVALTSLTDSRDSAEGQSQPEAPQDDVADVIPAKATAEPVAIDNEAAFRQAVLGASTPTLVDFYATWCPPCRALGPVLERVAGDYAGKVQVAKVDVDKNTELAGDYRVRALPYLVLIRDGKVIDSLTGYTDEAELKAWIDRHVKDT